MFVTYFLQRVLPFALALLGGVSLWWLLGPPAQVFRDVRHLGAGGAQGGNAPAINPPHGSGGGVGPGRGYNIGGGGTDYNKTFSARDVTRKAVLLSKPEPGYTAAAREQNVTGVVKLRVVLGADGRVSNISVVKGLPDGLTEQAIAAAKAIEFMPAQKDGRAVSQRVTIEYNFGTY